jgi:putrescine transport system permease protein
VSAGARPRGLDLAALAVGIAFLYLPILLLVVYSFNASRLVTVWGGFSTEWYGRVLANRALMDAAMVTLKVGMLSATIATVVGVCLALSLQRWRHGAGGAALRALAFAPMVMPEVITGLSLLLLFVGLGMDRGQLTVLIAHATLTCGFVAVVVQASLVSLDPALDEAARDLGATPLKSFLRVTLPLIMPAVLAGWLLAFTLSIDDLVLASFTSGPGASTLPMRIYSQVRLGVTPEINAISTMFIASVAVLVIGASLLLKRNAFMGR